MAEGNSSVNAGEGQAATRRNSGGAKGWGRLALGAAEAWQDTTHGLAADPFEPRRWPCKASAPKRKAQPKKGMGAACWLT